MVLVIYFAYINRRRINQEMNFVNANQKILSMKKEFEAILNACP
jgi:hypothetical protein